MTTKGGRLTFGTSISFAGGFLAEIYNINWSNYQRDEVDQTHTQSPDNRMEFDPQILVDPGELEVEIGFDPDATPPLDQPKESITISFPPVGTQTNGATWVCDGFMKSFQAGGAHDGKMTGTATIKFSGKETITAGS